jgi:hypothetical protein
MDGGGGGAAVGDVMHVNIASLSGFEVLTFILVNHVCITTHL